MLRKVLNPVLIVTAVLALAGTALAGGGDWGAPESFAASFEARAVGDPSVTSCPGLGPAGQKIEARYEGTFIPAEFVPAEFMPAELSLHLALEILFDRSTGVGRAEGTWTWQVPDGPELVARGELIATVTVDTPTETTPPEPDLELHGLLIGATTPPDPDMPAQMLVGNFSASLGDGATFPHLKGAVGDPSVGDPSVGDPTNPAVLIPAVTC